MTTAATAMSESQIAQEYEALLAFLYAAPVGLLQTDLHGQVELVNAHTAMLLLPLSLQHGGSMDNLFELLAPVVPGLAERVAAKGRRTGTVCDGLRFTLSPPGDALKVGSLRLVKLDDRRLIATITDITHQVQAEMERAQAEERLRFAMQAAQVGDWAMEIETGRISGSPLHDRCFGQEPLPEDWHIQDLLARVHADDRPLVQQCLEAAMRDGSALRSEFRVPGPDGRPRWLALHGRPLQRPGEPATLAGVVLETTHEREADAMRQHARELEAENQRLQETSRIKGQFVASMSHELRSPLTSIIGFAQLMRSGMVPPGSPEHDECLRRIGDNGQHLLRLINDVLDLSKIEAGKFTFKPGPLSMGRMASTVHGTMASQWQRKRHTVTLDIGEGLDNLHLDELRLRQVLYNLLSNAIKFTPDGGAIELRARALPGERFEIEVIDNGHGIAADDLPKLFTDFQQLDNSAERAHEGTGLGLALTRRLVLAQGGEITARSTLGQGTVFRIELPQQHPANAAEA